MVCQNGGGRENVGQSRGLAVGRHGSVNTGISLQLWSNKKLGTLPVDSWCNELETSGHIAAKR